jgi:hypothetical protein
MVQSKRGQFRRKRFVSALACLFFIAPFFIQVQTASGQADETSRSWNQPVKPFRIIGNTRTVIKISSNEPRNNFGRS